MRPVFSLRSEQRSRVKNGCIIPKLTCNPAIGEIVDKEESTPTW